MTGAYDILLRMHPLLRLRRKYYWYKCLLKRNTTSRACILCGNAQFSAKIEKDRYALPISIMSCDSCGLVMQQPFPTEKFLNYFYESGMYHGLYGRKKQPKGYDLEQQELKQRINVGHITSLNPRPDFSLLDYGTGNGSFLDALKKKFPQSSLVGIEPNQAYFEKQNVEKKFDFITLFMVLEHVYDPIKTLRDLAQRLSENGRIILEVPDLEKADSMRFYHIAHVFYFTHDTFKRVAEKAGLKILQEETENRVSAQGMRFVLAASPKT